MSKGQKDARNRDNKIIATVDRAARVLSAFTDSWDFVTLPEVARRAKLSKPTTFRILATLVAEGLVFQNEANSTYGLGFLTLRLADVVLGGIHLREPARAAMRRIRDFVNETVVLGVLEGDACCNIDSLEGTHSIGQAHLIGVPIPLYAGAPGRAMLAGMSDEAISAYLRGVRFDLLPDSMNISRQKMLREITQIRRRGYAVTSGDFMPAGHTIAVAIQDSNGADAATLHISFPQGRFSKELEDRCVKALIAGVKTISQSLISR
jgi:DNA-binding IclR family transcriptional regulator